MEHLHFTYTSDRDRDFRDMEAWKDQKPVRRQCQYCKQHRPCRRGPDPFLLNNFEEIEVVWLCGACFTLREDGGHLDQLGEVRVPA